MRKRSIFALVLGLFFTLLPLLFIVPQLRIIQNGEQVIGTVTDIIATENNDGDVSYRPEIHYSYNGQKKIYRPAYSAARGLLPGIGSERTLYVNGSQVAEQPLNLGFLAPVIGSLVGLLVLVLGIKGVIRDRRRFNKNEKLKRYGRRISARFVKKDTTSYKINNQTGTIIYVQDEGTGRMFQTHPIFSEFSVKWLEEHLFDVYIDVTNDNEYYIDIEKHFGHPESHQ